MRLDQLLGCKFKKVSTNKDEIVITGILLFVFHQNGKHSAGRKCASVHQEESDERLDERRSDLTKHERNPCVPTCGESECGLDRPQGGTPQRHMEAYDTIKDTFNMKPSRHECSVDSGASLDMMGRSSLTQTKLVTSRLQTES